MTIFFALTTIQWIIIKLVGESVKWRNIIEIIYRSFTESCNVPKN